MSCKTEEKIINEVQYVCTQFPAIQGMKFKMELIAMLGNSLPDIVAMASNKNKSKEEQISSFSHAAQKLFESAPPEKVVDLIVRMLTTGHTKRDGERITESVFNNVYAGDNLSEAYKAFGFIIQVNYKGFFKGQGLGSELSKEGNQ